MLTSIQTRKPQKNKFDLSREAKLTTNFGEIVPVFTQDVIPGDSFQVSTQQLVRFAPLVAPAMHRIDFKIDYFFVPYRLVWDEWKDFITGGEDGNDLPSYPRFKATNQRINKHFNTGSLANHLGIPAKSANFAWTASSQNTELSLLPFRAYQLIYHEYFRDQNVGTEYDQHTSSGLCTNEQDLDDQLIKRNTNWEKDYFTSALPFLQRGPEVTLPLGNIAPIEWKDPAIGDYNIVRDGQGQAQDYNKLLGTNTNAQTSGTKGLLRNKDASQPTTIGSIAYLDNASNLQADLSSATAATLNDLRKASALQQWLELMARAGSRYREQIFAMFGERIPDYTVQIPQYLGGGKTPIMISEVLQTYSDGTIDAGKPGDVAGHAIGLGDNLGFTQSFDEHGIILGLARVMPKSSYVQGLSKFWQKFDKFDHYFPQFANLGEQEVKNSELFVTGLESKDNQTFGYQQRYAEYKYANSTVAGDFTNTLAFWELSRRFSDTPTLNQSFIECDVLNDQSSLRIFAVNDYQGYIQEDTIWIQLYHEVNALRPMPYHANPMLT